MEKDLKWIKKHYGEQMMHLCRELFPKILEAEGLLPNLLKEHFPINSHYLAEDIKENNKIDNFKNYIFSLIDVEKNSQVVEPKTAVELMSDAGYILYPECKTEKDIQSFKKWWKSGEALCTFRGDRLNSCRVWFAVKKNAREIKRENFTKPTRQDEYGTSVISIQFSRGREHCLSIKNRYNHSVNNPDNTFNSDLDNITPGLADAFERDYGVRDKSGRFKSGFELSHYVCVEGKFYHYNYEVDNVYYCDGGVIIDNFQVKRLPPHQMLMDYFVVDFNTKTIRPYDDRMRYMFCDSIGEIKQMSFENGVLKILTYDDNEIEIGISPRNELVSYKNKNIQQIGNNFMSQCRNLEKLDMPNLQSMGDSCFRYNTKITDLNLPKLESMGDSCFSNNEGLTKLNLPELETMAARCFWHNEKLTELHLPKLETMGDRCFCNNTKLTELHLPKLETMGSYSFYSNEIMSKINLPELRSMGGWCFFCNIELTELDLPELKAMWSRCFQKNIAMTELHLPKLETMGAYCFYHNTELTELHLPKLESMRDWCFSENERLTKLNLPNLKNMDDYCFNNNKSMTELNLPILKNMGGCCFQNNKSMIELNLPELKTMAIQCFQENKVMSKLNLPKLKIMCVGCFEKNKAVTELNLPELESMGKDCFGLDKSQVNGQPLSDLKRKVIISKIISRNEKEQAK